MAPRRSAHTIESRFVATSALGCICPVHPSLFCVSHTDRPEFDPPAGGLLGVMAPNASEAPSSFL
jgi:hypothetical protein